LIILDSLGREWKAYLSPRLWILGVLLLVLVALAMLQYNWIDQVAQAERQRAKANLTTALSDFERDFDFEITRVLVTFQFPAVNLTDYSERYKEWHRRSPYPKLIRGVYILETGKSQPLVQDVIPGQPTIRRAEWERVLPNLTSPLGPTTTSLPGGPVSVQLFSQGGLIRSWGVPGPGVVIDGNPAFIVPFMPSAGGVARRTVTHLSRVSPPFVGIGSPSLLSPRWAVVVLDANYIKATVFPALLKPRFPNGTASDYDILVVDKQRSGPDRIIFQSELAPPENQFVHPDGTIGLFAIRMDCFFPSPSTGATAIADTSYAFDARSNSPASHSSGPEIVGMAPKIPMLADADPLPEILSRTATSCDNSHPSLTNNSMGAWELLVRYRAGSLDQVMATFRRRNLFISAGVLLVLALGICMLVVMTERARSLAQLQVDFALGVSHELRTPLTVIRVAADNLKKGMVENAEQAHAYGEIIDAHALELSSMIEETLAFSRVQAGSLIGKRVPVSAEQIVRSSLANCTAALQNARIEVEVHVAQDLPLVEANIRMVNRCLQNLIQNVVKYAAVGQWMAIRVDTVTLAEGERVQISVEDRGPGISPADLPHIFEPFYRGRDGEASQAPGVGLGLTLVKRVVEAHSGRIEVKCSDRGALFSLLLRPYYPRPESRKAVQP
jgi:signal transduction histidine kinase